MCCDKNNYEQVVVRLNDDEEKKIGDARQEKEIHVAKRMKEEKI